MSEPSMEYVTPVLSAQEELLTSFVATLSGGVGKGSVANLRDGTHLQFEPMPRARVQAEDALELLRHADFSLLLVRFLDVVTLEELRQLIRALPAQVMPRLHVLICRKRGEVDFKISCPKCGQKLMTADANAFRRVRCPHCKDFFTVPGQVDLIHSELQLPSSHLIRTISIDDAESCLRALEAIVGTLQNRLDRAKSATMRIEVPSEDAGGATV